jgi:gamma-glutamyltranspeptidase/glutathione hydrolase
MIVAPQPLAVDEGAKVLAAGGNAVDAAVTCAFVQMILSPHSCGIGGYALLNLHLPGSTSPPLVLDAPALAGSRATPEMWEDIVIGHNPEGWGFFLEGKVNDAGYQSICTPGAVRGLAAILERWGTIGWAEAIEPAARIAEEGFMVEDWTARGWRVKALYPEASALIDYIRGNPEASRIYLKASGEPYDAGDILRNPDYGRTLRRLAADGAEDFYTGALAEELSRDLAANGSFVTTADLAGYELRDEERTVWGSYHGYEIASVPSPHGGPTLIEILNILEGYDLPELGHNSPEYLAVLAMAMKAAFADRNPHIGDPAFVQVPEEWMMSKERAREWRDRIDAGEPIEVAYAASGTPSTTHVSVVDGAGTSVALTHSLGVSSGVITPGYGFMWNNSMINFHPFAGHPNSIAPGKGRSTGMCPTIVYRDGKPVLSIGAPGATRIITSIAQVIVNVLSFGMSLSDAVLAPRIDCELAEIRAQARIPESVVAEVRKRHPIRRVPFTHGGFALVHAIATDPETGRHTGAADTGAGGMALAVET